MGENYQRNTAGPNGALRIKESPEGRKYFTGFMHTPDGTSYWVRITRNAKNSEKGYNYSLWLEEKEIMKSFDYPEENEEVPF